MNRETLLTLADQSLAESLREEARFAAGSVMLEEAGLLLCRGPGNLPLSPNVAMRLDPRLSDADTLARCTRFYGETGAGFSLHLRLDDRDAALARLVEASEPLMAVDSPALLVKEALEPPESSFDLRPVRTADDTAAYADIVNQAYPSNGWPPEEAGKLFASPLLLLNPTKMSYLAYLDDRPVAAASIQVQGPLGLVSWVGTKPEARGRGLASAVTRAVTNAGFAMGAHAVWLVASTMGEPLYRSLGFQEFSRSPLYVMWPSLHELAGKTASPSKTG